MPTINQLVRKPRKSKVEKSKSPASNPKTLNRSRLVQQFIIVDTDRSNWSYFL